MNCNQARKSLSDDPERHPELARHLDRCPNCARFAERWAEVRRGLSGHRSTVSPDAGFAARVRGRLAEPPDALAWAAQRLLPASLALALALSGWCLLQTQAPPSLAADLATGDMLTWVAEAPEESR